MKILVTGGAGFQGSHICEYLLSRGHQVSILNTYSDIALKNIATIKDKIVPIWGSTTDRESVEKSTRGNDLIVHLAARIHVDESIDEPLVYLETNILGTYHILEAIRKNGNQQRLIYWSSCEVYGQPTKGKLSESSELRPQSPYAASKAAAERLCFSYFRTYKTKVVIPRFFNIFGPRQKFGVHGALIPILVEKALNKEPLVVSGDGHQTRDYLFVDDVVSAFAILLANQELDGQTINFASGKNTSVIDIASYIAKKLKVKIIHGPSRPGEVMAFSTDISYAKSLGFKPTVSIWEGIDRYINWRRNGH